MLWYSSFSTLHLPTRSNNVQFYLISNTATTAFNIFARAVVREKKIPFEIQASSAFTDREQGRNAFMALRQEAKQNGIQDMSLDEINAEIRKARYGEDDV